MNKIKQYSRIVIIFNPNSTGDAPTMAHELDAALKRQAPTARHIFLTPTKHPGHAEEIAYDTAKRYKRPLIVAVSGDGGYNEVINGVMRARDEGVVKGDPSVSVVGAGNANDHYRVVHHDRLEDIIGEYDPREIDLLKMVVKSRGRRETRYAHAYIGVGISPRVAEELNRHRLNLLKEIKILFVALRRFRPTVIIHENRKLTVDSLIFTNIKQMAKVLKLTDENSLHDGQFEIVTVPHTNILRLIAKFLRAALFGLRNQPQSSRWSFQVTHDTLVQIDGELFECHRGDKVTISAARSAIKTLR